VLQTAFWVFILKKKVEILKNDFYMLSLSSYSNENLFFIFTTPFQWKETTKTTKTTNAKVEQQGM
jgi:hypothetical protein